MEPSCHFLLSRDQADISEGHTTGASQARPSFTPQVHHLDFISQFTTDIRHIAGQGNPVADALSRLEANAIQMDSVRPTLDFQAMTKAQPSDKDLQELQSYLTTQSSLPMCKHTLLCDTSTGTPRPYVPQQFRRIVFNSLHDLSHPGHPGVRATQHLVTARFFWPGINTDVHHWARLCLKCQRSKIY